MRRGNCLALWLELSEVEGLPMYLGEFHRAGTRLGDSHRGMSASRLVVHLGRAQEHPLKHINQNLHYCAGLLHLGNTMQHYYYITNSPDSLNWPGP